jgi:hypothetical protein
MASIYDIVTAPEIAAYWETNLKYEEPYFGESKFPNRKILGLDLSWIKGARKAPVSLSLSAFDADVLPLKRGEVTKLSTEMPFFKNEYRIDEKTRQNLLILLQANNSAAIRTVVGQIFNDESSLMRNAALTREMLRMQLLTTGVIALSDNGQEFSYDFGLPSNHKVTPTTKWSVVASADPIADIETWQQIIENEKGTSPTEILMNSATLAQIAKVTAIKNGVFANSNITSIPTKTQTANFISEQLGVTVYAYDKGYTNNGTFTKFVPDGTVVLMPNTELGNTWFGTTPEESDLSTGGTNAQVSIVDTGVAISTWKENDPVTVRTKGSQIVLPSFELADEVIIASVL